MKLIIMKLKKMKIYEMMNLMILIKNQIIWKKIDNNKFEINNEMIKMKY